MKKILFTSLLCASFAANVNLLPAPNSIDETDGRNTEKQDADFLKAQNDVGPLIEDLQRSGLFRGGQNRDMSKNLASQKKIKPLANGLLFKASAFEQLVDMHWNAFRIQDNAKNPAPFKTPIAALAKKFDWKDDETENKSKSDIVTKLFALNAALSVDRPKEDDVKFAARTLKERLKPVYTYWEHIMADVGAMLAEPTTEKIEKVALSFFNHKGQKYYVFTTEDAKLLVDTFFAYMFSVSAAFTDNKEIQFENLDREIRKDHSLSDALRASEKQEVKDLYAKIRKRNRTKVRSVHEVFPNFLKQTVSMEPEDLKRFTWLSISLNGQDGEVTVAELLKACYPWHASKISKKNKSDAEQQQKTAIAAKMKALKKELQALEDQEKKLNAN